MNRIFPLTLLLTLTGCGYDSTSYSDTSTNIESAIASIIFEPDSGEISLPNDLFFLGSEDGTLNIDVDDESDTSDPYVSLNAIDGWSTHNPFDIAIDFSDDLEIDPTSIDGTSVQLMEVTMGGDSQACIDINANYSCEVEQFLTFGEDYTAEATSTALTISPLSPLSPKTSYLLVLTDNLLDSDGNSVLASTSYQQLQQDIDEYPLESEDDLEMQGIINSYEATAVNAGIDQGTIIYSMVMTTQSINEVLLSVKDLATDTGPAALTLTDTGYTIADILSFYGYSLTDAQTSLYSTGELYSGTVTLPYYLALPTSSDLYAPIDEHWLALCDSELLLEEVDTSNIEAQSSSDETCMDYGLRDLNLDSEHHLTQYNSLPAEAEESDLDYIDTPGQISVQLTLPIVSDVTNAVRASYGLDDLTQTPEDGWPVVMLQHGVAMQKEDMLAVTGLLSTFGFATVAIDLPLHGERGFDLDNDGSDDINATSQSYAHYMNLTNLLVTRDNMRQGVADLLGLRYALSNISENGDDVELDPFDVQFLGHSLGAITGLSFTALANTSDNDAIDPYFAIDSLSLAAPGVGLPSFLVESSYFGSTIESTLAYTYSELFQAYVETDYPNALDDDGNIADSDTLIEAYQAFYEQLDDDELDSLDTLLSNIVLAAQTATDSGDPINYTEQLVDLGTPIHLMEIVGDGYTNLSDQVIPNEVISNPNAGTEPAIEQLDLTSVSESSSGSSFAVRFSYGHHGSILSSSSNDASPDETLSAQATAEMQGQMASFFYSRGQSLTISDTDVIE